MLNKDHISKLFPGFTVTLCFGKSGGFHFRWAEGVMGICLWFVALTFYAYDLEAGMEVLVNKAKNNERPRFSAN